jgi:hypothetical protein
LAVVVAAETVVVDAGGGDTTNQECSQILRSLLANINIDFDAGNDTLSVAGFHHLGKNKENTSTSTPPPATVPPTLDDVVAACSTDYFNVELWRAIQSPNRPSGFGTWEYFSQFQNCENPNPDLLWKHGSSIQESLAMRLVSKTKTANMDKIANSSSATVIGADVDDDLGWGFAGPVKFFHVVERQYLIRMCPCRRVSGTEGGSASRASEHKCSCDHGSSAVCSEIMNVTETARQDQVFSWCRGHKAMAPTPMIGTPEMLHCPSKVRLTGIIPSCTPVRTYDIVEVVLQPMFHGINDCKELPRDSNGRIRRLVNMQPVNMTHGMFTVTIGNITQATQYCFRAELVNHPYCNSGSDITLNRLSTICRPISLKSPIMIEDQVCGRPEPCAPTPNLPLIAASSLFAALFLAIVLIWYHRYRSQKRPLSSEESALQKHLLQTTPLHPDIFFLYWEESTDFGEINRLVVRWLAGLGHRVLDLADEVLQEEMMASPEVWVLEKLENPNVKVIVVESETVAGCLKADPDATVCTRTAGIDGLRLISLRHIQARLASNYQRLSVIQYASGPRSRPVLSFPHHDEDSGVSALMIKDTNEVAVISGTSPSVGMVPTLVPHTRYSLPEHLAELQAWLVDTQSWDDNGNQESAREQTLRDLKAAVKRYTEARL